MYMSLLQLSKLMEIECFFLYHSLSLTFFFLQNNLQVIGFLMEILCL